MAMRYIVRRPQAGELDEIRTFVQDFESKLGPAGDKLRREIKVEFSPLRAIQFHFQTRKSEAGWIWVCPTIEMEAEDESGLFALTSLLNVPRPAHLAHLH